MSGPDEPMPRRPSEPGEDEWRAHARALFARRVALGTVALGLLAVAAAFAWMGLRINDSVDKAEATLIAVEDCTNPGGGCYQRTEETATRLTSDIGRVTVLAAACAASLEAEDLDVPQRADEIQQCILRELDEQR